MIQEQVPQACPEWRERIALYAAGGLSLPELAALRTHLDLCPACRGYQEQVELHVKILRSLPREKAPSALDDLVAEEIRTPESFVRRFFKRLGRLSAPPALWARVREEIAFAGREQEGAGKVLRWTRVVGAAAAGVLFVVGGVFLLGRSRPPRNLPLFVVDVEDPSTLSSAPLIEGSFGYQEKKAK